MRPQTTRIEYYFQVVIYISDTNNKDLVCFSTYPKERSPSSKSGVCLTSDTNPLLYYIQAHQLVWNKNKGKSSQDKTNPP